jgi:hypothetical protein
MTAAGCCARLIQLQALRSRCLDVWTTINATSENSICAAAAPQVLERLNNVSCGNRCAVGSGGKSVGASQPQYETKLLS